MSKRAVPYFDFVNQRRFEANRYDGAHVYKPIKKIFSAKEFNDVFYKFLYSGEPFSYRRLLTKLKTEEEIVKALDGNEHVSFYIGKKSTKNYRG
jgi:hypothetical protein